MRCPDVIHEVWGLVQGGDLRAPKPLLGLGPGEHFDNCGEEQLKKAPELSIKEPILLYILFFEIECREVQAYGHLENNK